MEDARPSSDAWKMSASVSPTERPLAPPSMATMTTQPSPWLPRWSFAGADRIFADVPVAMSTRAPGGVYTKRRWT
eukprot:11197110-Lingulodinium_polyedra.AAC.1